MIGAILRYKCGSISVFIFYIYLSIWALGFKCWKDYRVTKGGDALIHAWNVVWVPLIEVVAFPVVKAEAERFIRFRFECNRCCHFDLGRLDLVLRSHYFRLEVLELPFGEGSLVRCHVDGVFVQMQFKPLLGDSFLTKMVIPHAHKLREHVNELTAIIYNWLRDIGLGLPIYGKALWFSLKQLSFVVAFLHLTSLPVCNGQQILMMFDGRNSSFPAGIN